MAAGFAAACMVFPAYAVEEPDTPAAQQDVQTTDEQTNEQENTQGNPEYVAEDGLHYAFSKPAPDVSSEIIAPIEVEVTAGALTPLVDAVNAQRAAAGTDALTVDATLMDIAAQRVSEFERNSTEHAQTFNNTVLCSETVIRGAADPNTVLSSILLSDRQLRNLVYDGYRYIGIAVNETGDIWVIHMTS